MFKRNAEIKCYQAVFAFLFLNLLFCNVVRMSFGVRGVRAALSIVFFGVTIRKTFRGLSKTKRNYLINKLFYESASGSYDTTSRDN